MGKGKTAGHIFLLMANASCRGASRWPGCYSHSSCDSVRRWQAQQGVQTGLKLQVPSLYQTNSKNPHHSSLQLEVTLQKHLMQNSDILVI